MIPDGLNPLDYCLRASTSIVTVDDWKAAVDELDGLRDYARRWRRLRKQFFDKVGTPEADRDVTPIDDSVLHRFLFSGWEDAEKWRHMCKQTSLKWMQTYEREMGQDDVTPGTDDGDG